MTNKNYIKLYNAILYDEELSSTEKLLLSIFIDSIETYGSYAVKNRETLGASIGRSGRQVERLLTSLKDKGYIDYKKGKHIKEITVIKNY